MIYPIWRLSEDTPDNLGLACTDNGLVLGRTPLIEKRGACFVVRDRGEIARLLKYSYPGGLAVDQLMPGLATVAAALNANDPALARIAAVHLKIPDLPSLAARDALAAEDALIKYARDGGGDADWNPALHPRTGTPPNPGWFASTDGPQDEASHGESRVRFAANEEGSRRSGATPTSDAPITLPSDKPNDEPANFADRFGFSDQPATFNDRFGFGDQPANFNDRFGSSEHPGGSEFWSRIWPAIRAWLEEQVPEYDIEGGQVGERPRWRAIAPYVGIPIATAGIFGLEAYAPAIAAWLGLGGAADVGVAAPEAGVIANAIRGAAAEARVLRDLGLARNTQSVITAEGRSIPDALTQTMSVEIKDAAYVSATRQLRIQSGAASASGRKSILITGAETKISRKVWEIFNRVIRRSDLGPQ
jgi:hypothetical protein